MLPIHAPRPRRLVAVVVAVLVASSLTATVAGSAAAEPMPVSDTGRWIVQLASPSLAAHQAPSGEVDLNTDDARAYLDQLAAEQSEAAALIEEELGRPVAVELSYRNVLNAIVIAASDSEVARLDEVAGVLAIEPDVEYEIATDASHDQIGSAAIWGGETGADLATRGEGVVVGILDSGINAFHPSFAATDGEGYTHTNPFDGFLGVCDPAHPNHAAICNDKLVGAWSFVTGNPSPLDINGHGSHTASTAAGNRHEATVRYGADEFNVTVQGVAPRANVVAYRVCGTTTCATAAILAGINQAIADGVDVLNYSITGADAPWSNSVSRAFLEAFGAGIFVSTSAGNTGPNAGTVNHTQPWTASVAATTTDRTWARTLSVLAPQPVPPALAGIPAWPGWGPANAEPVEAELRYTTEAAPGNSNGCSSYPAGSFAGTVALIPLGTCVFSQKITNAANAGAVAVVLFERQPGPPVFLADVENTAVPAVSVTQPAGEALQSLATSTTDPVTVRLGATTELRRDADQAGTVSWFSSRGPSDFDLLAPTLGAPGVNILAAYAANGSDPLRYNIIRGTSMASPHVAGAGALMAALHPDWSPAQIRAALAGTADPTGLTKLDTVTPADPMDTGSGLLDLAAAGRVGLVMDESYADMLAANPTQGGVPRELNVPYLVNRQCVVVCSWTREVTNVADTTASYTATVVTPPGMTATVQPATFTIAPGATQPLTITVNVGGSSGGAFTFADLRLSTTDNHASGVPIAGVHYPIAVIPVAPAITVDPTAIGVSIKPDRTATRVVTVRNTGNGPLTISLTGEGDCDLPAGLGWLSVSADSGTINPNGSIQIQVRFDSAGRSPGVLTGTLCIASNDPAHPIVEVVATLTVLDLPTLVTPEALSLSQPAGTITGTPLTIGNVGTAPLEWAVGEAPVPVDGAAVAAVDPRTELLNDGVLLVPDTGIDGVSAFDPETGVLLERAFITYPQDLGTTTHIILNADQDGFFVSSQTENLVYSFGLDGAFQGVFAPAGGEDTSIMGNIRGMAISPWGTLLVTSATGNKVVEFDAETGELLGDFITSGSGGIGTPWYILFREDDVLVADSGGGIYQYDHDGAPLAVWNDDINFPQQMYRQENGNILTAAFSSPAGVWDIAPDGTLVARYTGVTSNRGAYPLGNGNVLTTNTGGVHEIDRGTSLVATELASSGVRMISEIVRDQPCIEPADVPWLSLVPTSGTTPAGGTSEITMLVDSRGLAAGMHEAHVCVTTNDPDTPLAGVPVTVTVTDQTCDTTITGVHGGSLRVTAGLTCLAHGSSVIGAVRVSAGASLYATGATVIGPVTVGGSGAVAQLLRSSVAGPVSAFGAATLELSGSSVTGPVTTDRTASVRLLGSSVVGPVLVSRSTVAVVLSDNTVVGPVTLSGNVTAPTPIVVAGNVVTELRCSGNDPPPVNDGRPNTVTGEATGQCVGL